MKTVLEEMVGPIRDGFPPALAPTICVMNGYLTVDGEHDRQKELYAESYHGLVGLLHRVQKSTE